MTTPLSVKHSFDLEGAWEVRTMGLVSPLPSDARAFQVKVAFRQASSSGQADQLHRRTRTLQVPLGETLDLFAGAYLVDDVVQPGIPPGYTERTVEVDLDSAKILQRHLIARTLPALTASEWDQDSFTLVARAATQSTIVLVPCMEVWRHEYLTSTTLGELILSGAILEPAKYLYSGKRSEFSANDRRATLMLRRGTLRCDAPIIGRIFIDEFARSQAQGVYKHFARLGAEAHNFRPLRVAPPMRGKCRWVLWCKEFKSPTGEVLAVAKIASSDAPFPWSTLLCGHEDDRHSEGSSTENPSEPGKPRGKRPVDKAKLAFAYLDTSASPGTAYVRRAVQIYELQTRFTALTASPIERKEPELKGGARKKRGSGPRRPASKFSAQKPGTGDRGSQGLNSSGEDGSEGESQAHSPSEVLRHTLDVVEYLPAIEGCSVRDRVVTKKTATLWGHHFNIPDIEGSRPRRWLFLDDERKQQRPIYLAEIEFNAKHLYLLEIVRKSGDAYSTLLVNATDFSKISEAHLLRIITACITAEGVTRLGDLKRLNLKPTTFPHRFTLATETVARRVLDLAESLQIQIDENSP